MRSSTVLAALGAALAVASPVHQALHNRKIVTDIVTDIFYVTVTEGAIPTPPAEVKTVVVHNTVVVHHTDAPKFTPQPAPPPPAPTTSTTTPAPAPVVVHTPAPPAQTPTIEATVVHSPAPVVAAPAPATPTDYISAAVDSHNYHRANHSASDISWSDSLAASALIVANTCVFQHDMYVYSHPSS
jgi:uncharacterized protein YkwD